MKAESKRGVLKEEQNGSVDFNSPQHFIRGVAVGDREPGADRSVVNEPAGGKDKALLEEKSHYLKLISVTQALSVFSDYNMVPANILEMAKQRGTRVHSACCAYAQNIYSMPVPPEWHGYFRSFQLWFDSYVDEVYFAEERFTDFDLGFHGQPDLGVRLKNGFECKRPIIDLKTPAIEYPTWKAQTAAYLHLANNKYGPNFFDGHMALKLDADGRMAKAISYKNQVRDFTAFMSALNAYRYFKS